MPDVFSKLALDLDDGIVLGTPEINKPVTVSEIYDRLCSLIKNIDEARLSGDVKLIDEAQNNYRLYMTKVYIPS